MPDAMNMSLDSMVDDYYFDSGGNVERWEHEAMNAGFGCVVSVDICEGGTTDVSSSIEKGASYSEKSEGEALSSEAGTSRCIESVNNTGVKNTWVEGITYTCYLCNSTFSSKDNLNKHRTKNHKKDKKDKKDKTSGVCEYLCMYCDKRFICDKYKMMHMNEKHSENKQFKCSECDHEFFL